jgi:hypothetical protein
MWFIMRNGKIVSKLHSTKDAAMVEAFEMHAVVWCHGRKYLSDGFALVRV